MPTWQETVEQLRFSYSLSKDDEDGIELFWGFDGANGTVEQLERIEPVTVFGRAHLLITAPACPAAEIDAERALRHNDTLGVGALAIRGEQVIVRGLVDLGPLTWPVLEEIMQMIAHEAARLRENKP